MKRVLFVCTGNIFRSLTAERALRHALQDRADIHVSSAGTADFPHVVAPNVREYLLAKGFDVSRHQRRTLTEAILRESHLVIAMSVNHCADLRSRFGRAAPLFLEACGEPGDRILSLTPRLASRLDALLDQVLITR
jgi:protein-tyrosine phosphatase